MFLMNYMKASMLDMKTLIHTLESLGEPQKDFLSCNLTEFTQSQKYKDMLKAQDYYAGKHDILEKKRYYIDRLGAKREDPNLSNHRLVHPYFTKLVNQKVNYLLSKEFSIQVDDDKENAVEFRDKVAKYFNKDFMRRLKSVGKQAIINGIAWVQVYYSEEGKLCFKRIPSEEVIPFWHDSEHTKLDAVLRFYTILEYKKNAEKEEITKLEYYTTEGVWYYEVREGKLVVDKNRGVSHDKPYKGHFRAIEKDEKGRDIEVEKAWNKIPFVAFKYNDEEISLLQYVKPLVDNYDRTTSDTSDLISDIPNSIKVVKGYGGTDKGEFTQNLATYRTIFIDDIGGGVEQLTADADTDSTEAHLSRLKEDIYEVGNGVNIQKDVLNSTSGVALKIRYADLDADCMSMASNFASSLEELCWFIKLDVQGEMGDVDLDDIELDFIFNSDTMINETDVVMNCVNSMGIISDETIIANHPWTTDLDKELKRVKDQKEEQRELEIEDINLNNGFGSANNTHNRTGVQYDDGKDD